MAMAAPCNRPQLPLGKDDVAGTIEVQDIDAGLGACAAVGMQVIAADMRERFLSGAFLSAIGIDVHPGALYGNTPVIAGVGMSGDDDARLDAKGIHGASVLFLAPEHGHVHALDPGGLPVHLVKAVHLRAVANGSNGQGRGGGDEFFQHGGTLRRKKEGRVA